MEQPTACRPARTRSSRQPVSTSGIRDRHALPSRTAHRRRRAARFRQIGGGQPSRRSIAGGTQSSRASLDRSGSARHARQTAGTSRQSHASLRRDLRPAKLPWAFDHRAFVRPGVPPFVRVARRGRNPVHEFVDRCLAAGLFDLIQRRRSHEIRLPGGCLWRMDNRRRMRSRQSGLEGSRALPQIAIPALSPRGTEEQGMTADANGDQEKWSDQEIYRNSQISDYFKFPPLGDWGSRGPGFKSRQPDSKELVEAMPPIRVGSEAALPDSRTLALTLEDFVNYRFMLDTARGFPAVFDQ